MYSGKDSTEFKCKSRYGQDTAELAAWNCAESARRLPQPRRNVQFQLENSGGAEGPWRRKGRRNVSDIMTPESAGLSALLIAFPQLS